MIRASSCRAFVVTGILLASSGATPRGLGAVGAQADVVVVVDSSVSMREAGMDPERSSLLVSQLLADISPGNLAVVRLLDLVADRDLIPSRGTGKFLPCVDNPAETCELTEPTTEWESEARGRRFGLVARPEGGGEGFKRSLVAHLEQRSNNSPFHLSFRAAQGYLEDLRAARPATAPSHQLVIWLSDGRSENPQAVGPVVRELAAAGVEVEAIVFGEGDEALPRSLGLETHRVESPAELMKAFAGAFRRIVQAPYEVDALLSAARSFEIQPAVDEAWVVVYGDDTLVEAELSGPAGRVRVDAAAGRWPGAGAYCVAHLVTPVGGSWHLQAQGGGPGLAYAVIQRSSLAPRLVAPTTASPGTPAVLVGRVVGEATETTVSDPRVLREATLTAEVDGVTIPLQDSGRQGDESAGDGLFSATVTFPEPGDQTVVLRLSTPLVARTVTATVAVSGPPPKPLTFWERWGVWLLGLLALLVVLAIGLGYVLPERFQPALALVFVPSRAEIEEQSPQPVRQWQGVGIGFYRNARAYLHPDYRLSGRAQGALAGLEAVRGATRVWPARGASLFRETLDGTWEPVSPEVRPVRQGDVFRVADRGPFFLVTSRRSAA